MYFYVLYMKVGDSVKNLFKYIRPFRTSIVFSLFLTALNNGMQILLPAMMTLVINNGVAKGDLGYVRDMGIAMVALSLGAVALGMICSFFTSKCATGFGRELRRAIFTKAQTLSSADISNLTTASLLIRNTNDVNQLQVIFLNCIKMIVSALVMMVGGTIMAFVINKTLSALLFVILAVIVVLVFFVSKKIIPMYDIVQKRTDKLNKILREKLSGIRVIRAFNREKYENERFEESNSSLAKINLKINRIYAVIIPVGMMLLFSLIVTLVYINSKQVMSMDAVRQYEEIANTVGNLQAFIMYVLMIIAAITMATSVLVMIPKAMISINRINEILNIESAVKEPETPEECKENGSIEFKNVFFRYPGADLDSLKDVSFVAEKGKTTAIIGSTGSGKSTVLNLIMRSFDVDSGEILIGGTDVRKLGRKNLCSAVSVVPQQSLLFSGTVADNLRFGNEEATDEEIRTAAEIAQATEFIESLPEKYDSMLYQGGKNLSGGQKQRLTIARALAKKADIYVFDDSFSALDFKTDAKLRASLKENLSDKTIIIVAQRIGSIADADRIVVLADGVVAGIGTHEDLSENCEVYKEIMKSQISKKEDFCNE